MKRIPQFLLVVAILSGLAIQTEAYVLNGRKWKRPSATMQLGLVKPSSTLRLIDGSDTFNDSAARALSHWNAKIRTFKFARTSNGAKGPLNGRNNVFFSNSIYSHGFGSTTVAVCITWY